MTDEDGPADRSRRATRPHARARTEPTGRMRHRIMASASLYPERIRRPRTRGECIDGPRPCPHVGCRHHLYLDVARDTGNIKINFPDLELEELSESCSLDVADRGDMTLDEVGALLNITRERVRQIEVQCTPRLKLALRVHR